MYDARKTDALTFDDVRATVDGILATAEREYEEGQAQDAEATIMESAWALEDFADIVGGRAPRARGSL
jgi:hypothetical protein